MTRFTACLFVLALLGFVDVRSSRPLFAADGEPVGVRVRAGAAVTLEPFQGDDVPLKAETLPRRVEIDGVSLLRIGETAGPPSETSGRSNENSAPNRLDVVLVPIGLPHRRDWIQTLHPRIVVPLTTTGEALTEKQVLEFAIDVGVPAGRCRFVLGNVFPVSQFKKSEDEKIVGTQVAGTKLEPYQLPSQWEELMVAKERQAKATAEVFQNLTAEQMNWSPPNGTHTPRWNAEHMMGRVLLFFSQIYHALEAEIPVMDLNPAQMPADYKAAHAGWSGAQEAALINRVAAFTRRYSYLLDGLDLDQKAPGSRWTPRALLKQMDWHFADHTGKTKLKFALPQWPGGATQPVRD